MSTASKSRLYFAEYDRPNNPIRDIIVFEKHIRKKYNLETRRRIFYFVIFLNSILAYIIFIIRQVTDIICETHYVSSNSFSYFLWRIYIKMLTTVLLFTYIFIRLFRKSSKITSTLSIHLKLLNIYFKNQKIALCEIKTPYKIKQAIHLFREEEKKRCLYWLKR